MIKNAYDGTRVRHAPERLVRFAHGENLRRTETADAFELPKVTELGGKGCAHAFENTRAIIKRQCNKCILVASEFIQFDATAAKDDLLFKGKRYRAVVRHAEGNLDVL